ncbi:FUSC family protein [Tamlana haliotis]|uniref:FUSC family protein n=1 Tax=Pseudotamlana haliotis TaxID=2614804 RepID=A0A6N6MGU3_9FLAO|nr:FUSC family protein [Tamlana haliotis]KAB1068666.1 FUSC family protein [Tamlana haliotis]
MKKTSTIIAFISAVISVIIAVLPNSKFTFIPALAALIFGFIAFNLSKKTGEVKKIIQFSMLLALLALGLSTYKTFFTTPQAPQTEALEKQITDKSEEESEEKKETKEPTELDPAEMEALHDAPLENLDPKD